MFCFLDLFLLYYIYTVADYYAGAGTLNYLMRRNFLYRRVRYDQKNFNCNR